MRCEIPVLLRCCFCFPLRYGLLVWAYIKQIFSLLFLTFIILEFCTDFRRIGNVGEVMFSALIIVTVVDIVFHVIFIISAHTKDYKKMRIFYRYSVALLCTNATMFVVFIVLCICYMRDAIFILLFFAPITFPAVLTYFIMLFIQGYLIILVRSEFMKQKNNSQFEFVNRGAEEICTANIEFVKGVPGAV